MSKLLSSIYKEILVLIRDRAGLAILFIMPMIMIFVITLVQDSAFKNLKETKISLVLVNNDADSLGAAIADGLKKSDYFVLTDKINGMPATDESARKAVANGKYQIGIIIPKGATETIRQNARIKVTQIFINLGLDMGIPVTSARDSVRVNILFDPVIKKSFKNSIVSTLDKFTSKIEAKIAFSELSAQLAKVFGKNPSDFGFDDMETVKVQSSYASGDQETIVPNSVQHNVPAWTMFAMFFLVIPLAGNMIKERDDGSLFRLLTMPGSYYKIFAGKIIVYLFVCLIQFALMLIVGVFFLPMLGLPRLDLGSNFAGLAIIAIASALAATGYGVAVGTIFNTQQQAASFGSVSIIILAALGGVWVPVFFMPQVMQHIAVFSPLNWGLNGFYDVFVRGAGVSAILPDALKLLGFFAVTMGIGYTVFRIKHRT